MSISIDNPLIFVYPKSLTASHQSHSALSSSGTSATLQTNSTRPTQPTLFPSFTPQSPSNHRRTFPDNQIVQSSILEFDSRSTILSGSLILKFTKPKEIKKIIISLCGQSCIGFNDRPYEYQTILAKDLEINLADQLLYSRDQHPNPGNVIYNPQHKTYILDKGNYRFHWSFILPPDLPPYERGQFGRTTHKVVAKVKLGSGFGLGLKNLPSIIFGVGNAGHEIETESYFVAITYPSGNNDDISDHLGLNLNVTELSVHLGPYTLSASSLYFTVAGLISFKFKLIDIPQRKNIIKIYKITCLIKQQYRLISMKDKDSRTGGPAESWPPCQRRRVFVLDHSNVPSIKSILPDGRSLDPSQPISQGHHQTSDLEASGPGLEQPTSSINSRAVVSSQPNERSPSHSQSRSQFRGFLRTHTRSRDGRSPEVAQPSHHSIHSWNSFSPIRIGRRRAESSLPETQEAAHEPRLSSSCSADGLGSSLSVSSQTNQHQTNSGASPDRDDASPSACQSGTSGSHRSPHSNQNSDVERNSQDSGGAASVERPSRCTSIMPSSRRGPHQDIPRPPSHTTRRVHNHRDQRAPKFRSGQRSNPHISHVDPDIPIVTLTDQHKSWEIEHMGRLPTDDIIRPSTNPGTQTNIHIFHTLIFEISYSVEDDKSSEPSQAGIGGERKPSSPITRKALSIRKPVQISSCCCMAESMVLPPYSKLDPNANIVQHPTPSHAARMLKCVCDTPTAVLLKTQNPKNPSTNPNEITREVENEGQNNNNNNSDNSNNNTSSSSSSSSSPSSSSSLSPSSPSSSSSSSLVTNSILTLRSSSSSSNGSSFDNNHLENPLHSHRYGINHLDNGFISVK